MASFVHEDQIRWRTKRNLLMQFRMDRLIRDHRGILGDKVWKKMVTAIYLDYDDEKTVI